MCYNIYIAITNVAYMMGHPVYMCFTYYSLFGKIQHPRWPTAIMVNYNILQIEMLWSLTILLFLKKNRLLGSVIILIFFNMTNLCIIV